MVTLNGDRILNDEILSRGISSNHYILQNVIIIHNNNNDSNIDL